jgi:hypothetical protein
MIKKGEVWKVDLEPTKGTEIKKIRSCVIIIKKILVILSDLPNIISHGVSPSRILYTF